MKSGAGTPQDNENEDKQGGSLRQLAEKRTGKRALDQHLPEKKEDIQKLIYELQVHQIELEIQNEELVRTRDEVEIGLVRYTELYDFAPVGYFTIDQTGIIRNVNLTGAALLGMERSLVVNRKFPVFVSQDSLPIFNVFIKTVFEQKTKESCDVELRTRDNFPCYVRVDAHAIGAGQECFMAIADITAHKLAERALQESEERYRTIMEQAADAIFIHDGNGRILDVNRKACQNLGYSREELLLKTVADIDHEAIQTGKQSLWARTLAGEQVTFESHQVRKNGSVFPVEVTLGQVHMSQGALVIGTVRDITGRRKAEEDLRMREQSFRSLAENLPGIVYRVYVKENGRMQFFNTMHIEMTGYTEEELTTGDVCSIDPLIVAEDRERVLAEIKSAIRQDRAFNVEYRITHKDGSIRFFTGRGRPLTDQTGLLYIEGIILDSTDRYLMESEIRSLNTVLEQRILQRTAQLTAALEEKNVLFREVHHRVKNNLQIIISLLNLQSRTIGEKKTQQLIRESLNRVRAMALVHEKLYESSDIARINLDNYIRFLENNLVQFYHKKDKGITFTIDIRDIFLTIDTAIPVGLILNELISNSLKYAFPDGRNGEISLAIHRQDHNIIILFKDNGIGIPKDFDWHDSKSLGLRLVISLVEQLQGTIELDRKTGTVFNIVVQEKE